MYDLIVTHAFGSYQPGMKVRDEDAETVLAGHNASSVVRVYKPEEPATPEAEAKPEREAPAPPEPFKK